MQKFLLLASVASFGSASHVEIKSTDLINNVSLDLQKNVTVDNIEKFTVNLDGTNTEITKDTVVDIAVSSDELKKAIDEAFVSSKTVDISDTKNVYFQTAKDLISKEIGANTAFVASKKSGDCPENTFAVDEFCVTLVADVNTANAVALHATDSKKSNYFVISSAANTSSTVEITFDKAFAEKIDAELKKFNDAQKAEEDKKKAEDDKKAAEQKAAEEKMTPEQKAAKKAEEDAEKAKSGKVDETAPAPIKVDKVEDIKIENFGATVEKDSIFITDFASNLPKKFVQKFTKLSEGTFDGDKAMGFKIGKLAYNVEVKVNSEDNTQNVKITNLNKPVNDMAIDISVSTKEELESIVSLVADKDMAAKLQRYIQVIAASPDAPAPGFWQRNKGYIIGGGVVVAILVAVLLKMNSTKKTETLIENNNESIDV